MAMEGKHKTKKERNKNESTNSFQKNINSAISHRACGRRGRGA
jgi:hypothetical protein